MAGGPVRMNALSAAALLATGMSLTGVINSAVSARAARR